MFGDSDLYDPDEMYADHVVETEREAREWFDSYNGFADDFEDDDFEDIPTGNADFMNDGFSNVYGNGLELED